MNQTVRCGVLSPAESTASVMGNSYVTGTFSSTGPQRTKGVEIPMGDSQFEFYSALTAMYS